VRKPKDPAALKNDVAEVKRRRVATPLFGGYDEKIVKDESALVRSLFDLRQAFFGARY